MEDVDVSTEGQSTFLAATEDKSQEGSKVTADLDYLDGSTIIAEVVHLHYIPISIISRFCRSLPSYVRQGFPAQSLG